jgi:hypothetical protein
MHAAIILAGLQLSAENVQHNVRITHSCDPRELYSQLINKNAIYASHKSHTVIIFLLI